MSLDFRTTQLQTSKIIASSSVGNHRLLIYSVAADGTPANQGNLNSSVFPTGSIGSDVFFFVSGSDSERSVFGGTLFASGNLIVSESKKIQATTIETITPSSADNRPNFSGVGVALGGWDSSNARSGSLVIRNHSDLWVPAVYYAAQHAYGYTDFYLGDSSVLTTVRGLHINLSAQQTVNILPGTDYSVLIGITGSNSHLIVGNNDNGTDLSLPFANSIIRAPSWYVDGVTIAKSGTPLKLFSGLGIGTGASGFVEIAAGKKNPVLAGGHTYSTVARFHGDNRFQLFGSASLDEFALTSEYTGSIIYNIPSGTLNFVDDTQMWRAVPKLNFIQVAHYQAVNVLSTSFQVAGQVYINPSEIGFNRIFLRVVASVTTGSATGTVKLYNETFGTYCNIYNVPISTEFSVTETAATVFDSEPFVIDSNFSTDPAFYELHIYNSTTGSYLVLGDAKLCYS